MSLFSSLSSVEVGIREVSFHLVGLFICKICLLLFVLFSYVHIVGFSCFSLCSKNNVRACGCVVYAGIYSQLTLFERLS